MTRHPWRGFRTLAVISVAAAALVTAAVVVPTADAQATGSGQGLTDIRVGRHATYDRIVLDFRGPAPSTWHAAWVRTLTADPSGRRITLPGKALLSVTARPASATDVNGHRTYTGPTSFRTPQLATVEAVAITGDFERVLSIGFGTRHPSWVHVFRLTAPNRLVVDVGR
ncbi:MAG TPA: hypothetical protein VHV49_14845 [Pseudonocardiaceae bacterium]|jgi:hypothetical protein|nr:hypothetical protein [Pseudonocardiaceae bacterium]